MSVPYPVEEFQYLQIPDPDRPQPQYSPSANTPFILPQQQLPYPGAQPAGHPQQQLPYPPGPGAQPSGQVLPTSQPYVQGGYGQNFQESISNQELNEGLHDLGRNLLKQGNYYVIIDWCFYFTF